MPCTCWGLKCVEHELDPSKRCDFGVPVENIPMQRTPDVASQVVQMGTLRFAHVCD